jgi:hypothetical protein
MTNILHCETIVKMNCILQIRKILTTRQEAHIPKIRVRNPEFLNTTTKRKSEKLAKKLCWSD